MTKIYSLSFLEQFIHQVGNKKVAEMATEQCGKKTA